MDPNRTDTTIDYSSRPIHGSHHLDRRLDIRNARQLVSPLAQLRRLPRLPVIVRARFSVPLGSHKLLDERLKCLRPVAVALGVLEEPLFELEFFLCCGGHGGVACVDDESRVFTLGRDIVVRGSGVP